MARQIATAAVNELRDSHYRNSNAATATYQRTTLLELASTNVCLRAHEFDNAAWTSQGTPVVTANAATAPDGTVTADSIEDNAGGAIEYRYQDFTVANDSTFWTASVYVKNSTSAGSALGLSFHGGGTELAYGIRLNWSTGTINASTASGSVGALPAAGFSAPTRSHITNLGNGWSRISVTGPNNSTGNTTMRVHIVPAITGAAGTTTWTTPQMATAYFWGAQVENLAFPTSYIATTSASVTRAVDQFGFSTLPTAIATPREMTVYLKFIELGTFTLGAINARILQISESASSVSALRIYIGGGGTYVADLTDSGAAALGASTAAAAPVYGDMVELRAVISSTPTIQLGQCINGGTEAVASASASLTLPTSWGTGTAIIRIGHTGGGTSHGCFALVSFKVATGSKTLEEMRALADMAASVLVLNAGDEDAITVACAEIRQAESEDIGGRSRAFAGNLRVSTRDQKRAWQATTAPMTYAEARAIETLVADNAIIPCDGILLDNTSTSCSLKVTGKTPIPGTQLAVLSLTVTEV